MWPIRLTCTTNNVQGQGHCKMRVIFTIGLPRLSGELPHHILTWAFWSNPDMSARISSSAVWKQSCPMEHALQSQVTRNLIFEIQGTFILSTSSVNASPWQKKPWNSRDVAASPFAKQVQCFATSMSAASWSDIKNRIGRKSLTCSLKGLLIRF